MCYDDFIKHLLIRTANLDRLEHFEKRVGLGTVAKGQNESMLYRRLLSSAMVVP